MTQPPTITSRFLSHPNQLGVVAVGFNGGQVRYYCTNAMRDRDH
jgi:arginase